MVQRVAVGAVAAKCGRAGRRSDAGSHSGEGNQKGPNRPGCEATKAQDTSLYGGSSLDVSTPYGPTTPRARVSFAQPCGVRHVGDAVSAHVVQIPAVALPPILELHAARTRLSERWLF